MGTERLKRPTLAPSPQKTLFVFIVDYREV